MTETVSGPGRAEPRPRRPERPGPYPVAAGSLAAFLGLFGFMAYQLRTGQDPALGGQVAGAPAPAKRVVVKRIERRAAIRLPVRRRASGATSTGRASTGSATRPAPTTSRSTATRKAATSA